MLMSLLLLLKLLLYFLVLRTLVQGIRNTHTNSFGAQYINKMKLMKGVEDQIMKRGGTQSNLW